MIVKWSMAAALLLGVSACAPSAVDGVARAKPRSTGLFGMVTPDAVKVDRASAFKGLDRVIVGSFIVGFGTLDTLSGKAGRGTSAARNTLVGVDDAVLRQITDEAYASFNASLRAAGYTVADPAPLLTDARFAATKSYPNPYVDGSGGIFGDTSVIRYLVPSSVPAMKIFQGDIRGTLGGFALDNPLPAAIGYAQTSGTKVLHVVYVLNFVNDAREGGLRLTNTMKVGQGVTAAADVTKVGVLADMGGFSTGNGTISLGHPITSDKAFATVADVTSTGNLVGQAAVNVLGGLSGIGGGQSRSFDFTARPGDYAVAARDALQQANAVMIGQMAALR